MLKNVFVFLFTLSMLSKVGYTQQTTTYQFASHSSFAVFWKNLQQAVAANDKDAIAKMMYYTFVDYSAGNDEAAVNGKLNCTNEAALQEKFTSIFCATVKEAIAQSKFQTISRKEYDIAMDGAGTPIAPGEYFIKAEMNGDETSLKGHIIIVKVKGKYKLHHICFYS
jgi:hypothetical protein